MISARIFAVVMFGVILSARTLGAQDLSRYRDFGLGSSLSSIAKTSGVRTADVIVVHRRPAIIQEVTWRPPYGLPSARVSSDPVREVVFSFYNDQLFRILINYDRSRTEGMTNEDMIQAVSALYGSPVGVRSARAGLNTVRRGDLYQGTTIAQWEDGGHAITLRRGTYLVAFQLVVASRVLDNLAQAASVEAVELDESEAPQREADQRKKDIADAIVAQEKARLVNKAAFRP